MFEDTPGVGKAIVPIMPYRNVAAMIDWLCDVYGFEKQLVVTDEDGEVRHAQLGFGESAIALVPVQDPMLERLVVHPDQIGGVETQTCYLAVANVDAHCAKAKAKGAEIVFGIGVKDRGGRGYASRDPEGHIWIFGTCDLRQNRRVDTAVGRQRRRLRLGAPLLALVLLVFMAPIVATVWTFRDVLTTLEADVLRFAKQERVASQGAEWDAGELERDLIKIRTGKESAERKVAGLLAELAKTRAALDVATQTEKEARELLAEEKRVREGVARAVKQKEDRLGQERIARKVAEKVARDATAQLGRERFARATAERVARERAEKCELERKTRSLAERSVQDALAELARARSAKVAAELAASELRSQLVSLGTPPQGILALRDRVVAERRARERFEREAEEAKLHLAQERHSRDASERALRQAKDRLAAASCWACPTGAPCSRP